METEQDNVPWSFPLSDSEIAEIANKATWYFPKPIGINKLNPLAWWRYYKIKRHLVFYWPLQ